MKKTNCALWLTTVVFSSLIIFSSATQADAQDEDGEYVVELQQAVIKTGKYLGLIPNPTMKVPDYYATSQVPENYEFGKAYEIDQFDCDHQTDNCKK